MRALAEEPRYSGRLELRPPEAPPMAAPAPQMAPPQPSASPAPPATPVPEPQAPQVSSERPLYKPAAPAAPATGSDGIYGDEGATWAALADVFLNRGRGVPGIIAKASEMPEKRRRDALNEQYRQAQIASLNRGNQGRDPRELDLRERALDQADQRLTMQGEREKRLLQTTQAKLDELKSKGASGEQIQQFVELQRQLGVPDNVLGALKGMSMETAKVAAPQLREQSTIAQAPALAQAAGQKTAAQTGAKIDVEHAYAPQIAGDKAAEASAVYAATIPNAREKSREVARGTQEGQGDYRERRLKWDQSQSYAQDNKHDLRIGGLINEINKSGGAAPQDFAERFRGDIMARGIDPARLEAWQAKQLVLETWARQQSGAAISATEDEKFALQTGMGKTASPEQVNAAYNVLDRVIQRSLRANAVNNPSARDVLFAAGVSDDPEMYLGQTTEETQANARAALPPPRAGQSSAADSTRQTAAAQEPTEQQIFQATQATPTLRTQQAVPPQPITGGNALPAPGPRKKKKVTDEDLEGL